MINNKKKFNSNLHITTISPPVYCADLLKENLLTQSVSQSYMAAQPPTYATSRDGHTPPHQHESATNECPPDFARYSLVVYFTMTSSEHT